MTHPAAQRLTALFQEAASAHDRAFAATNGEDPHWPTWYAEYLAPELEDAFSRRFDVAALAADLVAVDAEHRREHAKEPWPEFSARWFLRRQMHVASP